MRPAHAKLAQGQPAAADNPGVLRLVPRKPNAELYNNLGDTYRALGDRRRAEAAFRKAIEIEPRLTFPRRNLGMLLIGSHRWDEALAELAAVTRIDSTDSEAWGAMAGLYAGRGAVAQAAACFGRAIRHAPDDPRLARLLRDYPQLGHWRLRSMKPAPNARSAESWL